MTGKERIRAAMHGEKADRVPFMPQICFPHAVRQLEKDYTKGIIHCVEDPHYRMELMFEITRIYHSDGFRIQGVSDIPMRVSIEGDRYVVYRKDTGARLGLLDLGTGGLSEEDYPVRDIGDVKKIHIPSVEEFLSFNEFSLYREACIWAGDDFNKVGSLPLGISTVVSSRGMKNALYDLYDDPQLVETILDKNLQIAINRAKALHRCGMDTIYAGDPWSSSSVISPAIFEQYSFPCFKRFVDEIRPLGMTIYTHICGNVSPILERIVEIGADCLEPMDPLGGTSAEEFRRRVGPRVGLMGGVNTVTLSCGTPDDIRKEALACIDGAGRDGGYILAAGDMVPFETPKENVMAMLEAAQNHVYGIL
jgi:uroporphyrinogen-III decarboxylase